MPLYCYVCNSCGYGWEDIAMMESRNVAPVCPDCKSSDTERDFSRQNIKFFPDIAPYFDWSIGRRITGRRDKANKYRAAGMTMLAGGQGGDSVVPSKTFYNDEEHHDNYTLGHKTEKEKIIDELLEERVRMGVEGDYADS